MKITDKDRLDFLDTYMAEFISVYRISLANENCFIKKLTFSKDHDKAEGMTVIEAIDNAIMAMREKYN